jgi:hypothetical protein
LDSRPTARFGRAKAGSVTMQERKRSKIGAKGRRSIIDLLDSNQPLLGDYRVLFSLQDGAMRIFGVRHRSEAYR